MKYMPMQMVIRGEGLVLHLFLLGVLNFLQRKLDLVQVLVQIVNVTTTKDLASKKRTPTATSSTPTAPCNTTLKPRGTLR